MDIVRRTVLIARPISGHFARPRATTVTRKRPTPFRENDRAKNGAANGAKIGATLGGPLGPSGGAVRSEERLAHFGNA